MQFTAAAKLPQWRPGKIRYLGVTLRIDMKKKEARSRNPATAMQESAGAKDQIKAFKETLILDAAGKLFTEKGFQRTTLDDISAALGVAKPFIYACFKSKDHVLERLFERVIDEVYQDAIDFGEMAEKDPVKRFEHFVLTYIRKNLDPRSLPTMIIEEEKHLSPQKQSGFRTRLRQFDNVLSALIVEGVQAGVFDVKDTTVAALAISSMIRWAHRWFSPTGRLSANEVAAEITHIALRVVGWNGTYAAAAATEATTAIAATASMEKTPAQKKS